MSRLISTNDLQAFLIKYFSSDDIEKYLDSTICNSKEERNAFKYGMIWAGMIIATSCYPFEASLSDTDIERVKEYYSKLSISADGKPFFSSKDVENLIAKERE